MTRRRFTLSLLLAVLVAVVGAAACGSDDPAADPTPTPEVSPPATATPPAAPSPVATPTATATPSPAPAATATPTAAAEVPGIPAEIAAGAVARLADWLGEPEADIAVVRGAAIDWPSACLGVEVPDDVCAQVVTPGYELVLAVRGDEDRPHRVHASEGGDYAWAPAFFGDDVPIRDIDADAGTIEIDREIIGGTSRVVPGTRLDRPLAELDDGDRVHLGLAYGIVGTDASIIVWLVPAGP